MHTLYACGVCVCVRCVRLFRLPPSTQSTETLINYRYQLSISNQFNASLKCNRSATIFICFRAKRTPTDCDSVASLYSVDRAVHSLGKWLRICECDFHSMRCERNRFECPSRGAYIVTLTPPMPWLSTRFNQSMRRKRLAGGTNHKHISTWHVYSARPRAIPLKWGM